MKKLKYYFLLLYLGITTGIHAQTTYVPDDNFEQALIDLDYDDVLDDYVLTSNISEITTLNVNSKNISDLTGLENFVALTDLSCGYNQLLSLNVSANTALTFLYCGNNNISSLDVSTNTALTQLYCERNQITGLDLSTNTALTLIRAYSNHIATIDISTNTALNYLDCSGNQLSNLDISNTSLTTLLCNYNQFTNLDVSANTALNELRCINNQLTSLDVRNGNNSNMGNFDASSNPNLSCIYVDDNTAPYLSSWTKDVNSHFVNDEDECNALPALTYVPDDNFEQALIDLGYESGALDNYVPTANIIGITSLNISSKNISNLTGIEAFAALTHLSCFSNQLTALDISANTALTYLGCGNNQLTALDVSANTALMYFDCNENQLTTLDVSKNTALISLNCSSNLLTTLDVSANTALIELLFYSNQLTAIDVSANTALTWLHCESNQLTELDVSKNTALTDLGFAENQLIALDVSTNTALTKLGCSSNQLTALDVSANTALISLYCSSNQLSALDVRNGNNSNMGNFDASSNPGLSCIYVDNATWSTTNWTNVDAASTFVETEAECDFINTHTYVPDNNFEQALIDLGYDDVLDDYVSTASIDTITSLNVNNNNISDLTGIEDFVALEILDCGTNQLLSLDVSLNTVLTELGCGDNQLLILDVFANTALTRLSCRANQLTSLDVSSNTALTTLSCFSNQITDLNLSTNAALTILSFKSNQLSSIDISANTLITHLDCQDNELTSLDVSSNDALTVFRCYNNQLTSLDIRNGNNEIISAFNASDNPDLTCIYVDDKDAAYLSGWDIDATSSFVNNEAECSGISVNEITFNNLFIYPNPSNGILNFDFAENNIQKLTISDITGKIMLETTTVKQKETIDISRFNNGIYIVRIQTNNKILTTKIMKQH